MKYKSEQEDAEFSIKRWQIQKEEATKQFRALKKETPPEYKPIPSLTEADMVCPCCGQPLPENMKAKKIAQNKRDIDAAVKAHEKALAEWQKEHDKKIKKVTDMGQKACDGIRDCEKAIEKIGASFGRANEDLKRHEDMLEQAQHEEAVQQYVPDMASAQQLDKLKERESYLTQLFKTSSEIKVDRSSYEDAINRLRVELADINQKLAVIENNDSISAKIESLQEERKDFEQAKATAEMMLYQIDILSRRMNDLFVEEINSHFSLVKWQLFEYQKNGTYKEICVPTIDGYRFGESTNTGREIRGKLDICQSLQKF